jgi:ribonucleoside-diphosphate reductase alpha chain
MQLTEKQEKIFKRKYAIDEKESWDDACLRVSSHVASAEKKEDQAYWASKFFTLLNELVFLPGGRILANSGTYLKNLGNCFVLPLGDSRQEIYQALKDSAEVFAWGGGAGFNFSKIREEGSPIKSNHSKASGPLSFMSLFDQTGEVIQQASRRGAMLGLLDDNHPDIEKFIGYKSSLNSRNKRLIDEYKINLENNKLDWHKQKIDILEKTLLDDQLTHFNISVSLSDKLFEKAKVDGDWDLISRYDGFVVKTIKAKDILNLMAKQAWESGDPGLSFVDRINEDNLVPYYGKLEASNPCLDKDTLISDGNKLFRISNAGKATEFKSWKTGNKECIKLITNAGHELILTPEHKIMVKDGTFIEAKDSLGKEIFWCVEEKKTEINETYRLLGFIFGKGFICKNGKGISIKLSKNKESEIYNKFISIGFIREDHGYLYINKEKAIELFGDISFLEKNVLYRNIPDSILLSDKNILRSFISGLFEANGNCNLFSQISLKTTCKELAKQVQIILGFLGIKSWICTNRPSLILWKNRDYISKESYNVQISPRNSYKFKEFIGFISEYKNSKIKKFEKEYDEKLIVKEIEPVGIKEVWDFTTEKHYKFSNGFVAHNCGELSLFPYEACCLGSINLLKFVDDGKILWSDLEYVTRVAVRFLDNVQILTEIPVEKINETTKKLNRIGLGVMGWADMLAELNIPYNSPEAIKLAEYLGWFITNFAWLESLNLAKERGAFPLYDPEKVNLSVIDKVLNSEFNPYKYDMEKIRKSGVRNVSVTCIAPTGTIALIAGVNSGIEPFFALAYKRYITDGIGNIAKDSLIEINPILLKKLMGDGLPENEIDKIKDELIRTGRLNNNKYSNIFKTALELNWKDHVNMQAAWQKYISSNISKTINMENSATVEDIYNAYNYMWEKRLKGGTIYRNGSKQFQILNIGKK